MIAHYVTIIKNNQDTEFMQACDVFEKWKVVGSVQIMKVTYVDGVNVDYERAQKLLNFFVDGLRKGKMFSPVFVHLDRIEGDEMILLNSKLRVPYYRDQDIKMISTGRSFYMLDDFIKRTVDGIQITE